MPLGFLTFLVSIAYVPLPSYATIGRWTIMAIGVVILVCRVRPRVGPGHILGLIFLAWCVISTHWSVTKLESVDWLLHLAILAGVFMIASCEEDIVSSVIGLGCGVAVSAVFGVLQWYGHLPVDQINPGPAGLFLNKDYFAEVAVPCLILCTGYALWAFLPAAIFGSFFTTSRVGIASCLLGAPFLIKNLKWRAGVLAALVVAVAAALYIDLSDAPSRMVSLNDRASFWQYTIINMPAWIGYGLGSYPALFFKWEHAHNEYLEFAFELGPLGILPILGVFCYALSFDNDQTRPVRAAFLSILVSALGYFPFHFPTQAYLAVLLAGYLCGYRDRLYRQERSRRSDCEEGLGDAWALGREAIPALAPSRRNLPIRQEFTPGA